MRSNIETVAIYHAEKGKLLVNHDEVNNFIETGEYFLENEDCDKRSGKTSKKAIKKTIGTK